MEAEPVETTEVTTTTKKKKSFLGKLVRKGSKKSKKSKPTPQDGPGAEDDIVPVPSVAVESRNGAVSSSASSASDADQQQMAAAEAEAEAAEREAELAAMSVARDGTPVISSVNAHLFQPSDVRDEDIPSSGSGEPSPTAESAGSTKLAASASASPPDRTVKAARRGRRQTITLDKPPTARESAYGGPPKYDWIDIVSIVLRILVLAARCHWSDASCVTCGHLMLFSMYLSFVHY